MGRRPLPDAHQVRRAPRLQDRAARGRRRQVHVRHQGRRRVLASSSSRAARTACSASRRPSRRAASTRRRRRSRCCPRPRTSTSTSTRTTCRSTSTARRARAGSRSTRPTRRCASRTSRAASSSRCRTRSRSCRTASKAMRVLRARLYEQALAEQQAALSADRKAQVGTGERAEKIRTYNYGERRVTDHRIKLTQHNLEQVLEGELDEFTDALQADEKRRKLEAQADRGVTPCAGDAGPRRARLGARRAAGRAASTRRGSTPRCCSRTRSASTARALIIDRDREVAGPRGALVPGRSSAGARSSREPVAYLARPQGLPPPRAGRRPARARPAAGDRAARRGGARAAAAARASSTSARAAARSRSRSSTSGPDLDVTAHRRQRGRARRSRARTRERLGLDVACRAGRPLRRATFDAVALQPAVRRRRRRAAARGRAPRAARARSSPAPTGSTSIRRLVARRGAASRRSRSRSAQGRPTRSRRSRARPGSRRSRRGATSPGSSAWWWRGADAPRRRRDVRALHRGRRRRGVPGRHGLRPGLRARPRRRGRAPLRAQGPAAGQARGGHVLRSSTSRSPRCPSSATRTRAALEALLPGAGHAAAARTRRGASRSPAGRTRRRSACASPRCRPRCALRRALAGAAVEREPRGRRRTRGGSTTCPSRSARAADLVLDGGELPGTPSTVVDLRPYETTRRLGASSARARSRATRSARASAN